MPNYYGQNREDEWICANVELPTHGFYVDVGCGHPFTTSNTAFLRDRKWNGLAIDGHRGWESEWADIPAFTVAVIASQPEVLFYEDSGNPYWSRLGKGSKRAAETIEELLERFKVKEFDFLSVDTEGSEHEVIQSFDFKLHNPKVVIVEYNAAHIPIVGPDQSPIPAFMEIKGYTLRKVFPPVNMIFTR
jgi:hypothetical protein